MPPTAPNLATLPPELLELIISHIPQAQGIASLSATCRSLHHFIITHGWGLFVREHFPVQALEAKSRTKSRRLAHNQYAEVDWAKTANDLTALSRDWESKDFRVRFLNPPLGSGENGIYHSTVDPVLDCWEDVDGSGLRDDRLVVGVRNTILVWRRKELAHGMKKLEEWSVYPRKEPVTNLPTVSGRPQIGSLKILEVDERFGGEGGDDEDDNDEGFNGERVFVFKKLAALEMVELKEASHEVFYGERENQKAQDEDGAKPVKGYKHLIRYDTNGSAPFGADVSPNNNVVAAALKSSNSQEVAIYPLYPKGHERATHRNNTITRREDDDLVSHQPISISIASSADSLPGTSYTRQLKFLSDDRFVTVNYYSHKAAGPALSVWQINSKIGLQESPIWELDNLETATAESEPWCAVTLPDGCHSIDRKYEASGNLFLSGWSDGKVHLHDLRTPPTLPPAQVFTDRLHPWKNITSLCALGYSRFAASVANTSLIKIYDLRMPGYKAYTYQATSPIPLHQSSDKSFAHTVWATNLSRDTYISGAIPQLCTGSSFGRGLYAGLLGQVAEVDFWDKTPEIDAEDLTGYTFNQNTGIIRKLEYKAAREGGVCGRSSLPGLASGWSSNFCMFVY